MYSIIPPKELSHLFNEFNNFSSSIIPIPQKILIPHTTTLTNSQA